MWFPFVRIMAFIHYAPVLDNAALTIRIRIILSLALAFIITPLIPTRCPPACAVDERIILTTEQFLWGMLSA